MLQASEEISLSDLNTEFGGGNKLSDYYRGGGLVADYSTNSGIPPSGEISLSDFYGASNSADFSGSGSNQYGTHYAYSDLSEGSLTPGVFDNETITRVSWAGDEGNESFRVKFLSTSLSSNFFTKVVFRGTTFYTSAASYSNGQWSWVPNPAFAFEEGGSFDMTIHK